MKGLLEGVITSVLCGVGLSSVLLSGVAHAATNENKICVYELVSAITGDDISKGREAFFQLWSEDEAMITWFRKLAAAPSESALPIGQTRSARYLLKAARPRTEPMDIDFRIWISNAHTVNILIALARYQNEDSEFARRIRKNAIYILCLDNHWRQETVSEKIGRFLVEVLEDSDPNIRWLAANTLRRSYKEYPEIVEGVAQLIHETKPVGTRTIAVELLAQLDGETHADFMFNIALTDQDSTMRTATARTLYDRFFDHPTHGPTLQSLLYPEKSNR